MPVTLHHVVVDAHDLPKLAQFWTQALGWRVLSEREHEIVIGPDVNAPTGICFMPVTDPKTVKNRVHLDLTTSAADRNQEIERPLALGARPVDIGRHARNRGRSSPIPKVGTDYLPEDSRLAVTRQNASTNERVCALPRRTTRQNLGFLLVTRADSHSAAGTADIDRRVALHGISGDARRGLAGSFGEGRGAGAPSSCGVRLMSART
jgi:Glyoxalase-like domain